MKDSYSIDVNETVRHATYDANGYIFTWRGRIFRAIHPENEATMRKLWDSGLLEELIKQNLFPETSVADLTIGGAKLVFEHEKIDVVTYPPEWSFHMLKDAALATLKVNRIARKFGYQTLDAHGFNLIPCNGKMMFVDMGSFIPVENDFGCKSPGWRPYGEFMRSFYAPLKMWSKGESYFSRHSLYGSQMPMSSYWRYRSKTARVIPKGILDKWELLWYKYKALNTVSGEELLQWASLNEKREKLSARIQRMADRWGLPFSSVNLEGLIRKVESIKAPKIPSMWADYHAEQEIDDRQKFVIETIRKLRPASVLDMAGNAGFFSKAVAEVDGVDYVICGDYDENAIDTLYRSLSRDARNVYPAVVNFAISIGDSRFLPQETRFQCDMVMALALTHHLLLTQKLTLDFIMDRLSAFTKRYVAVEFMPLGLYSSKYKKIPKVPDWYTEEWFRKGFEKKFTLLERRKIATNRIIFIGEKS